MFFVEIRGEPLRFTDLLNSDCFLDDHVLDT